MRTFFASVPWGYVSVALVFIMVSTHVPADVYAIAMFVVGMSCLVYAIVRGWFIKRRALRNDRDV